MSMKKLRDGKVVLTLLVAMTLIGGASCWSLAEAWGANCYEPKINAQVACVSNTDLLTMAQSQGYTSDVSCNDTEDFEVCNDSYSSKDVNLFPDGYELASTGATKEQPTNCWRLNLCQWSTTLGVCQFGTTTTPWETEPKTINNTSVTCPSE